MKLTAETFPQACEAIAGNTPEAWQAAININDTLSNATILEATLKTSIFKYLTAKEQTSPLSAAENYVLGRCYACGWETAVNDCEAITRYERSFTQDNTHQIIRRRNAYLPSLISVRP